jgi:hypothetical protein
MNFISIEYYLKNYLIYFNYRYLYYFILCVEFDVINSIIIMKYVNQTYQINNFINYHFFIYSLIIILLFIIHLNLNQFFLQIIILVLYSVKINYHLLF